MHEIIPGVWHWTTLHERWEIEISSYLLAAERVLIDPCIPDEGIDALAAMCEPAAILLTNRHHYRHSGQLAERFGCRVRCNEAGLHEFTEGEPVDGFAPGETLPGDVIAMQVGAICPDETALYSPRHRAIAMADGLVRMPIEGPLGFVPEALMDDPAATKRGLIEAFRRLLDLEFDHLLLAHGGPIVGTGRDELARFVVEHED